MKLLSIAIPCYNSAAYMRRCIDSLLPGGEDVEILIVNDGSTDNTKDIAEEYRERFPSMVKVINKKKWRSWLCRKCGNPECSRTFLQGRGQ